MIMISIDMVTTGMIDYKRATVGYSGLPCGCALNFFLFSGAAAQPQTRS